MIWETFLTSGVLALAAIPIGRYFYIRFYLSRKLFFESWINLSRNESFEVGGGLAELLYFELEEIRKVLDEARSDSARLWNDKSAIPALERSSGGYPEFVRHTDMLGLSGKLTNIIRLILLARPPAIRGSIHQYGADVRFQVVLESLARQGSATTVPCWSATIKADEPERIPNAVSDLAHNIALEFEQFDDFKSPQTFRSFTTGLRGHLAYNKLRHPNFLSDAEKEYRSAILFEGGNAAASCNLGDLLYNQFTFEKNEEAIKAYKSALKTEKPAIRARAFIGLANAYCQRRQRHGRGNQASLVAALRWAGFAEELCRETPGLDPRDKASIKKAEAYAQQVWAELGGLAPEEKDAALKAAVSLYMQAIDLNQQFTAAHNNLSYLYLKKAENSIALWRIDPSRNEAALKNATSDLERAESWCGSAIETQRSFHFAHDNQGNIAAARAWTANGYDTESQLALAVTCYHRALSYEPGYTAAHSDLAGIHSRLFSSCEPDGVYHAPPAQGSPEGGMYRVPGFNLALAWQHHWEALGCVSDSDLGSKSMICQNFGRIRATYCVPHWGSVLKENDVRTEEVKCVCMNGQVGR